MPLLQKTDSMAEADQPQDAEMVDEFAFDNLTHLQREDHPENIIEDEGPKQQINTETPKLMPQKYEKEKTYTIIGWEICLFYGITKFNKFDGEKWDETYEGPIRILRNSKTNLIKCLI